MQNSFTESVTTEEPIDQGQIFEKVLFSGAESYYKAILVTAVCDIVNQDKLDYFNFCAVLPFRVLFFNYLNELKIAETEFHGLTVGNDKEGKIVNFIKMIINGQFDRYHWLGKLPNSEDLWYVDYQLSQTIQKAKKQEIIANRIAKTISPIKESIYGRFSNYIGRVGLPGNNSEKKIEAKAIYDFYKSS